MNGQAFRRRAAKLTGDRAIDNGRRDRLSSHEKTLEPFGIYFVLALRETVKHRDGNSFRFVEPHFERLGVWLQNLSAFGIRSSRRDMCHSYLQRR